MAKLNGKYIFCIIYPVALLTAVVNLFLACSNSQMAEDPEIFWEEKIEECSDDEIGNIYYYVAKDEYKKCENGQWLHIDIKSSAHDTLQIPTDTSITENYICENGDKKFIAKDSSYVQCLDDNWEPIDESWLVIPISERFLQVKQGKFIPDANFNTPFTLQPPQPLNNGEVKCTFDGSEPDSTTPAFTENKIIDTTTVVRCYEFANGEIKQKQTETYFINESIGMPVVSISVDPMYVKDYLDAEPCKPDPCFEAKFWEDVEYPTHVEYFAEGSEAKEKGFEIDAGISIAGNYSRNQQKKSVSIVMRKKYQNGKLHYPLFETRPENNKFKAFILRNNGNRFVSDYIEDAMATSLLEGTNVDYQRSRQVIVFYNGQYRGIYDMREKLNEHFVETNYGIKSDNVNLVKQTNATVKIINGNDKEYQSMFQFIHDNDFKTNTDAFDALKKILDIPNFIDYMAAEIYYHNGDWPQNNVRAWKSNNTPWRFIAFDIDHGFDWTKNVDGFAHNTNMLEWIVNGGRPDKVCSIEQNAQCFHNILKNLLDNQEFKQAFINRTSYLYSTFINAQKISSKIDEINKTIDKRHIEKDQQIYNRTSYKNRCGTGFDVNGDCLKKWSTTRDISVRNEIREFFKLGDNIPITISIKGQGRLKLDGTYVNPGSSYEWTVFENHPMQLTVECYAGSKFIAWENDHTNPSRTIYPQGNSVYSAECN